MVGLIELETEGFDEGVDVVGNDVSGNSMGASVDKGMVALVGMLVGVAVGNDAALKVGLPVFLVAVGPGVCSGATVEPTWDSASMVGLGE